MIQKYSNPSHYTETDWVCSSEGTGTVANSQQKEVQKQSTWRKPQTPATEHYPNTKPNPEWTNVLTLGDLNSNSKHWCQAHNNEAADNNSTVICLRQLVLQVLILGVGGGVGDKMAEWMVKGHSQHKWYEAVQELLLKQMEQCVGLVHNVEEVDFRFRLWLRNGYACQQIIHSQ